MDEKLTASLLRLWTPPAEDEYNPPIEESPKADESSDAYETPQQKPQGKATSADITGISTVQATPQAKLSSYARSLQSTPNRQRDLTDLIKRENITREDDRKLQHKLSYYIQEAIKGTDIVVIVNAQCKLGDELRGTKMWEVLTSRFEKTTQNRLNTLQTKWHSSAFCKEHHETAFTWASRVANHAELLRAVGATISEQDITNRILEGLPSAYTNMKYHIRRAENFMHMLELLEEAEHDVNQGMPADGAMIHTSKTSEEPTNIHNACGTKHPYGAKFCPLKCDFCKRNGHTTENCYKKQRSQAANQASTFLTSTTQPRFIIPEGRALRCTNLTTKEPEHASTHCCPAGTMAFLVDSGATSHMSPFEDDFVTYRKAEQSAVQTANGATMRVVGHGTIPIHVKLTTGETFNLNLEATHVIGLKIRLFSSLFAYRNGAASVTTGHSPMIQLSSSETIPLIQEESGWYMNAQINKTN